MYKLAKNPQGVVSAVNFEKNGVQYSIPFNPDNTDYQEYLKWVAEGNTPQPADE
jgi:hypothetical protein